MGRAKDKRKGNKIFRQVSIDIPDRGKDEDPITTNQLKYIEKLSPEIKIKGGLENLGKWQASAIIEQLIEQQEKLEMDIAKGKVLKGGKLRKVIFIIIILIIMYIIIKNL